MPNNNNKSLYIYTSLIFLVAVILIIISFFGQSKLANVQPDPISVEVANSITERAAALSQENAKLIEENTKLEQQLSETTNELIEARAQLEIYKKSNENSNLLLSANTHCENENYAEAKSILETIDTNALSENENIIYENVKKACENADK